MKMRYQKRNRIKRGLSGVLALVVLMTTPFQSIGAIDGTKNNSRQENEKILEELKNMDEDRAPGILEELEAMGLVDQNGGLVTTSILVDGEEKNLQEVFSMIEDGADLNQKVTVEDTQLTLGDLKIMAEIEEELSRIENTYFNKNGKLTEKQEASLKSIKAQLGSEGMDISGFAEVKTVEPEFPLGIQRDALIDLTVTGGAGKMLEDGSYQVKNQDGKIQVVLTLNKRLNYDVSLKLRVLEGSAGEDKSFAGINEQTVSFPRGTTEKTVDITLKKMDLTLNIKNDVWSGDRLFVIQAYDPVKILFDGQKTSLSKVVRVTGDGALRDWIKEKTEIVNTMPLDGTGNVDINKVSAGKGVKNRYHSSYKFKDIDNYLIAKGVYILEHRWWIEDSKYTDIYNGIDKQPSGTWLPYDRFWGNYLPGFKTIVDPKKAGGLTDLYGDQYSFQGAASYVNPGFKSDWGGYHLDDIKEKFTEADGISLMEIEPRGDWEWIYPGGMKWAYRTTPFLSKCNMKGLDISNGFEIENWRERYDIIWHDSIADPHASESYTIFEIHIPDVNEEWEKNASKIRTTLTVNSENPQVIAISAPAGTYTTGQLIPITVQFNMPVKSAGLRFGNRSVRSAETDYIGEKLTFLYEVNMGETKTPELTGTSGNTTIYSGTNKGISIKSDVKVLPETVKVAAAPADADAFRACSISMEQESYGPADRNAVVYVDLPEDKTLAALLTGSAKPETDGSFTSTKLKVCTVYGDSKLTLTDADGNPVEENAVKMKAEVPLDYNTTQGDRCIGIELGSIGNSTTAPEPVIGGPVSSFIHSPAIPMKGENLVINYPEGFPVYDGNEDSVIYKDDDSWPEAEAVRLTWEHDGKASYTWPNDALWSSSNETVALIDPHGQITFTGSAGEVTFTLTAENGDKYESSSLYQKKTAPIKVGVGYRPYLEIPDTINPVSIRDGQTARVRWTTNLFDKNADASGDAQARTDVTVTLYEAEYDNRGNLLEVSEEKKIGTPVILSGTPKDPIYTHEFEGLNKISEGKKHSYVAVISIEAHENVPLDQSMSRIFEAQAYIDIISKPVSVKLGRPEEGLYLTSGQNVTIPWELEDFDQKNGAEFQLKVVNHNTQEVCYEQTNTNAEIADSGSIMLPVDVSNGYCEAYTIEVSAKNQAEESSSRDGYLYRVYDEESLQLVMRGLTEQADGTYLLSNRKDYRDAAMREILSKNRQIFLQGDVSMNADAHPWKELTDPMKWSMEDNEDGKKTAALNYLSGGEYRDIDKLNYETYVPTDEFLISGLKNGETKLSVEHGYISALRKEAEIEVETLKDRLYLFQFRPAVRTEITYTDADGGTKKVISDDNGQAAIYEEEGIHSNLYLKSEYEKDMYLGTIYPDTLASSEQDAADLELYPLNNMTLKKVASIPVYLKKPDGTPYDGKVKVYGGVIQNGVYCERAEIDGKSGKTGFTISMGKTGAHTFRLDLTQFEKEVLPQDDLEFMFQLEFPDGAYYPMFLSVNGNLNNDEEIRMAERVMNLETVAEGEKDKPFTSLKRLYFSEEASGIYKDIKDTKIKIGPGSSYPAVTLETYAIWWGQDESVSAETQSLQYTDERGVVLKFQESEELDYPFLHHPVVKNVMHLDREAMDELKLLAFESAGVNLKYKNGETSVPKQESGIFRIVNMLDTKAVSEDDGLTIALKEIAKAGNTTGTGQKFGSAIMAGGISLMSAVDVDLGALVLRLSPTEDPTVFNGFISLGVNSLEDDNVSGLDTSLEERNQDLDYVPGLSDIKRYYKNNGLGGYANESENLLNYAKAFITETGRRGMANGVAGNAAVKQNHPGYALNGYFESRVFYDYEAGSWRMQVLNGGFTAGGGYGRSWSWNASVGPVPVLAQLAFGAGTIIDFKAAVNHTTDTNDYMTQLRIMAYIRAFGGLGFDYEVLALKVGLYGQVNADMRLSFLNKAGSGTPDVGFTIGGNGEVGVEFLIKCLFISYERIFWGKDFDFGTYSTDTWNANEKYWEEVKDGKSEGIYETVTSAAGARKADLSIADEEAGISIYSASDVARVESREYLKEYERSWNQGEEKSFFDRAAESVQSILRKSTFLNSSFDLKEPSDAIMDNAYPYAAPSLTNDGKLLFYLSDQGEAADVSKTRVAVSVLGKDGYTEGDILSDEGYGDSQLKTAGENDRAAAVYSRVTSRIKKEPGAEITADEQEQMMTSTEIMCTYQKNGRWITDQLTDNAIADMAPTVAVSGDRMIVAWRQTAGSNSSDLVNFDEKDEILYRIYNRGRWSKEQVLYNGTNGSVSGLDAAMIGDRAAVTYTVNDDLEENQSASVDPETGAIRSGAEVYYAVIDASDGAVMRCTAVTGDDYLDENPQITHTRIDGVSNFILGWHSIQGDGILQSEDIRLLAFDKDGNIKADFPDSIRRMTDASGASVSGNFKFSKGAETLDQLSLVWKEASMDVGQTDEAVMGTEEAVIGTDKDQLRAIRFTQKGDVISLTAPQIIDTMKANMAIDSFDAYVKDGGNTIQAVMLRTYYDNENPREVEVEYEGPAQKETDTILLPKAVSSIFETDGSYEDQFKVDYILPDYRSIARGMKIPVQAGITNEGTQSMNALSVKIGDQETAYGTEDGFKPLAPGESRLITAWYQIPDDKIDNPEYSITAVWDDNTIKTLEHTKDTPQILTLDVADVGISGFNVLEEQNGERLLQIVLYNGSDAKLAGSGKSVNVGLYLDADCTKPIPSEYLTEVTRKGGDAMKIISDKTGLEMVDDGSYVLQYRFDIESFIRQEEAGADGKTIYPYASETGEIRKSGIQLHARTWISAQDDKKEEQELSEFITSNNVRTANLVSLLDQSDGEPASLKVSLNSIKEDGYLTSVKVEVQNNSIRKESRGNLIVSLLDEKGNVAEVQQLYKAGAENDGLLSLDGEEVSVKEFRFKKAGTMALAEFSNAAFDDKVELAKISLEGTEVALEEFKQVEDIADTWFMTVETENFGNTPLSVRSDNINAVVLADGRRPETGDGGGAVDSMASNLLVQSLELTPGKTKQVVISVEGGLNSKKYILNIINRDTGEASENPLDEERGSEQ